MNPHTKLTKQLSTQLHIQQLYNHINVSFLDHITNKEVELKTLSLLQLTLMEQEPLLLNTFKLKIKIKNGFSMIETGLFIMDHSQN
jgi:hypothetical protein